MVFKSTAILGLVLTGTSAHAMFSQQQRMHEYNQGQGMAASSSPQWNQPFETVGATLGTIRDELGTVWDSIAIQQVGEFQPVVLQVGEFQPVSSCMPEIATISSEQQVSISGQDVTHSLLVEEVLSFRTLYAAELKEIKGSHWTPCLTKARRKSAASGVSVSTIRRAGQQMIEIYSRTPSAPVSDYLRMFGEDFETNPELLFEILVEGI